jgi:cyclopropane fatty-acyl-phospholipid synthase-like methyltransferase
MNGGGCMMGAEGGPVPNAYDAIAGDWHANPRRFGARKYLDLMLEGLRPGARVLDLGCGTGEPVALYLIGKGFRVVGVDESAAMLEIARRVVPEAELIEGDMCDVELAGVFDAAVAWDSLFHVERARHRAVFRKISGVLAPGGRLLLSTGGTGHPGFTSEMYGRTFFYSGFEPEEVLRLLGSEGFEVELCEVDDPSSLGHLAVVARKAAGARSSPENSLQGDRP